MWIVSFLLSGVLFFAFCGALIFFSLKWLFTGQHLLKKIGALLLLIFSSNVLITSTSYALFPLTRPDDQELTALWLRFADGDYSCQTSEELVDGRPEFTTRCQGDLFEERDALLRSRGVWGGYTWHSESGGMYPVAVLVWIPGT